VRRYRVRARGRITQERLDKLKDGVTVEGVRYGAIEARIDKAKEGPQGANIWISVTLTEGKNREIRRVFLSLGLHVSRLIRLSYGPFALGTLEVGRVEEVGPRVIREQLADHIAPQNLPTGDRPLWRKPAKVEAGPRRGAVELDRGGERPARTGAKKRFDKHGRPAAKASGEPAPKKEYKAGWAKPKKKPVIAAKGPGSKRAAGPGAGPRGPKPSASPPRTRAARRPAPPRSGGPKPRG
jgi:23S rRNA pseudouridine2605 synthase